NSLFMNKPPLTIATAQSYISANVTENGKEIRRLMGIAHDAFDSANLSSIPTERSLYQLHSCHHAAQPSASDSVECRVPFTEVSMKPENVNENMTRDIAELTLEELDEMSGGDGRDVIGVAAGGVTMLVGGALGSDIQQIVTKVAAKYQQPGQ